MTANPTLAGFPYQLRQSTTTEHRSSVSAGFLVSAGPILGNLPFMPAVANQALTLLAIFLLWPEIRKSLSTVPSIRRSLGVVLAISGLVTVHLFFVSETTLDKTYGLQQLARTLVIIVPLCFAFYALARRGRIRPVLDGMIFGALGAIPAVLFSGGTVANSHIAVGQIMCIGALLAFFNKDWHRSWRLLAGTCLTLSTFTAGSRGAFLAVLLGILVAASLGRYAPATTKVLYMGAFLAALTLVGFTTIEKGFSTLTATISGEESEQYVSRQSGVLNPTKILESRSTETRKEDVYGPSISRIKERPIAGFGFGASSDAPPAPRTYPHNIFLELTLNFGVAGVLAGIAGLTTFCWLVVRNSAVGSLAIASSLTAMMLTVQVSGSLTINRMLWVLAALALGNLKMNRSLAVRRVPERNLPERSAPSTLRATHAP